ncbi:CST complex subunit TEN1 [Gracilariopsis chorda]|uniref:CST complex subunit TEN1 n=1 Tax=Gracilariopsis chorda TaxID=448386 RepID=A0A2V3J550_9FLOR|nr:CST complex subunit TEN1 [Gracilariopsis chorda]|eukprot:PXF49127.1 CST complex subunit TEN1 [Gracilariopsis chorda]
MSAANMPDIKSGKLMQLSELDDWKPDDRHGSAVRVIGRLKSLDYRRKLIFIEYRTRQLAVHTEQLGEPVFGSDQIGKLFMFLGELERFDNELLLRARIARELTGVDPDLYDRCLKVRKDFDKSF